MPATLRGVTGNSGTGPTIDVTTDGGTRVGDILIAFHAADGSIQTPLGGGSWQPVTSRSNPFLTVRAWWAVATTAGTTNVTFRQSFGSEGEAAIAVISGGLAATPLFGSTTGFGPSINTPSLAYPVRGVELRFAAGFVFAEEGVTLAPPAGYTPRYSHAAGSFVAAALASRSAQQGTSTGVQAFTGSSESVAYNAGITVGVLSDTTAEAPPVVFPPFAPGRGTSQYRYSFRRVRDGVFLGDLDLEQVTYDKRINQAGTFSARMPITNESIGDAVDAIVPRDPTELDRGPGAIVVDIWRAGEIWGEYWITAATISQEGRSAPVLDLQGTTLDAYLLQVEIQEDLDLTNEDEIEIVRSLILHAQSQPYADLGLQLASGNSGNFRDRIYEAAKPTTYGAAIAELAKIGDGFEHMINMTVQGGTLQRNWVYGAPKLGNVDAEHVFTQPGDVAGWSERRDALRGGTRFRVRGGTPQAADATESSSPVMSDIVEATAHLDAGHMRIDRTLDHPSASTDPGTLDDYAAWWAARNAGAVQVHQATVILGAEPSLTPNRLGDLVRLVRTNPWHKRAAGGAGYDQTLRVIGISVTPTSRAAGRERCQLIFEEGPS